MKIATIIMDYILAFLCVFSTWIISYQCLKTKKYFKMIVLISVIIILVALSRWVKSEFPI